LGKGLSLAPEKSAPPSKRPPTTGAALLEQARAKNRWMAIGAAAFVIAVFVGVMVSAVVNERNQEAHRHDTVKHAAAAARAPAAR